MQVTMMFIAVILSGSFSLASSCRAVRWPFSAKIQKVQAADLRALPREHLYAYLYKELSVEPAKRIKGLAPKLFYYLINSELNEDHYQMLLALEWAADLQTQKPRVIPIAEICSLEEKIREPSSVSSSRTQRVSPKTRKSK